MKDALTIDASVFVNAFSPTEAGSEKSWRFLTAIFKAGSPIYIPTLMLVEVVASLARKQNNTEMALNWMREIQQTSHLVFINLDAPLAQTAAEIAAHHRLRGSDAVYVAVARRFGATLVTLDAEQRERAAAVVPVRWPEEV
ncbi:MAG: type II toxin-antitoxin system VapC family toxin [Thermoflexales bacterium]|nr:type II toxin-antitoxin system VapC family toxin [Thermoflexales bacterium]